MLDRQEVAATVRGIFDRNRISPFASGSLPYGLDLFIAGVLYEKNASTYGLMFWHTSSFDLPTGEYSVVLHAGRYDGLGAYGQSQGKLRDRICSVGMVLGEEDSERMMVKDILLMIEDDIPKAMRQLAKGNKESPA